MFYLKYVVLELKNGAGLGTVDAGAERGAKEQESNAQAARDLEAWKQELRTCGIQVLTAQECGDCRLDGAKTFGGCRLDGEATLYVTEDANKARSRADVGFPVMGVLQGDEAWEDFAGVDFLVSDLAKVEPDYLEKVYRRYAGIPWDILETERCLVRETSWEDAGALYGIYAEPSITEHMEDLPKDRDAFQSWLSDYAKHVYGFLGYGIWTICLKGEAQAPSRWPKRSAAGGSECLGEAQAIIGRAGLTLREGYDAPELGFVIGKKWQGRGLAKEVCGAILAYAGELGIEEVIAFAEPENEASRRLLRRLGFHETKETTCDGRTCLEYQVLLKNAHAEE